MRLLPRSWDILETLRRENIPVLERSIPVLYFGDVHGYLLSPLRVITVALNPSDEEFPDGPETRFPGVIQKSMETHFSVLNRYFEHNPLWKWFRNFDPFLDKLGTGFHAGRSSLAVHTDLCSPVATQPTYSSLPSLQQRRLEELGLPLWAELAELLDPDVIVMSGGIPMRDRVPMFHHANWRTIVGTNRKTIWTAEVDVWGKRRLAVFGFTTNVPFGALSFDERRKAGALVRAKLDGPNLNAAQEKGSGDSIDHANTGSRLFKDIHDANPLPPKESRSVGDRSMIYENFSLLMETELLPRRTSNPTHIRLDGEWAGGNREVAGRFRYQRKVWKIHADTHYEPLIIAYEALKADTSCSSFVEERTAHGMCLVLADSLRKLMSKPKFKHLYIYEDG